MSDFEFQRCRSRRLLGFAIPAVISLVLCVASASIEAAQVASELQGRWSGKIDIPGHELLLIVDLARQANWTGSATLPALNVKGAQLTEIKVQGVDLSFGIQALIGPTIEPPKIKAHLADKKLVGDFIQGGNTARVVLEKTGPPQVEAPPRSTPVSKEFEGEWKGEYEMTGYPRHVTIKLANHPNGATAEFVILGKKFNNLPVNLVTQEEDLVTIGSAETGVSYEGRWQKQTGEFKGTLFQGAVETPLVLRRAK